MTFDFHEDRQWDAKARLANGRLAIAIPAMQDLVVEFAADDRSALSVSDEYTLAARLRINGNETGRTYPFQLPFRIDGDPPQQVVFEGFPSSVPEGQERITNVRLTCRDLTGPSKVAYGFVEKPSDALPPNPISDTVVAAKQVSDEWSAGLELIISDLKAAPTRPKKYYFKAIVEDQAGNQVKFPAGDTEPPVLQVEPMPTTPAKGRLTVVARWRNAGPIEGAKVSLTGPSGQALAKVTDANGKATFPNLDFGTYSIRVVYDKATATESVELKEPNTEVKLYPSSI